MPRMSSEHRDIYVPKIKLEQTARIYNSDLENLAVEVLNDRSSPNHGKVNLWDLIRKLKEHYEKTKKLAVGSGEDFDAVQMEKDLVRERILKIRIQNQTILKQLIAKSDAEARVINLLNHYIELLETYIEQISESFTPVDDPDSDPRTRKENLTKMFNELFETIVRDKGEVKSWEEDGNTHLLATRVLASSKDSKEAQDYLNSIKKREIEGDIDGNLPE